MITVPEAVDKIINRSRYLTEAISKGIVNNSSLARYIKPEIEEITHKNVSQASVVMALNRLSKILDKTQRKTNTSLASPDISINSELFEIVIENSNTTAQKREQIFKMQQDSGNISMALVGKNSTTFLFPEKYLSDIKPFIKGADVLYENHDLSAITVRLSIESLDAPGVFYSILKSFAWEEINIIDVFSTYLDFTIVIEKKDVETAFSVVRSIFLGNKEII